MIRKVKNPYIETKSKEYNCFGCSPYNDKGLHLHFILEGEELVAHWNPEKWSEGFMNVVHGGIQATLLDELSSWIVQIICKTVGVTTSMDISYRKALLVSDGEITLRAKVAEMNSRMALVDARLFGGKGDLCAMAKVKFFLFPLEKAKSDYYYPGYEAFLGEEITSTQLE